MRFHTWHKTSYVTSAVTGSGRLERVTSRMGISRTRVTLALGKKGKNKSCDLTKIR